MNNEYINTLNTLDDVEKYRSEVNEACDKRVSRIKLLKKAFEISNKPFGYIKECFENFAPVLFNTSEGRKLIKNYTNEVKKNSELSTLHSIYENIRKSSKESDIDFLVNNIISENVNLSSKKVEEATEQIGKILSESFLYLGDEAYNLLPEENISLNQAVKYITENTKHIKNLADFSSAVKVIREEIESHGNIVNEFKVKDLDTIANELMREFNEKYNDKLSDEEKNMVKELAESTNKSEVFNKYKEICANKINEAKKQYQKEGNIESVNKLSSIFEQVSKKIYTEGTEVKDICNFIEIASIF